VRTNPARLVQRLLLVTAITVSAAQAQNNGVQTHGTVEKIKVHGKSLEGNLEGDSPDRDVFIYLSIAMRRSRAAATRWCISCMVMGSTQSATGTS